MENQPPPQGNGNGGGNKNPDESTGQIQGSQTKSALSNLDLIEEVDPYLVEQIKKSSHLIPSDKGHYLQDYVNQMGRILLSCKNDLNRTDPEQTACDIRWILTANIETIKIINHILGARKPLEEERVETILKLLNVQNNLIENIPFRMTRALMLFVGKNNAEDNKLNSNQQLIVTLVDYLYSKSNDNTPVLNRNLDPIKVSFSTALERVYGQEGGADLAEGDLEKLNLICSALDWMFNATKELLNFPIKKIRKQFAIEKGSTRSVREKIEEIIYHNAFILLLHKANLEMIVSEEGGFQEIVGETLRSMSVYITDLVKKVKGDVRDDFKYVDVRTVDGFSKKLAIIDFEQLIDNEFIKFYTGDDYKNSRGVIQSIVSAYGIGMISILHNRFRKFINPKEHHTVDDYFKKIASGFLWETDWGLNDGDQYLKEMSDNLVHLIKLVKDNEEAVKYSELTEMNSKYPRALQFAKIVGVKKIFTEEYLTIIKSSKSVLEQAKSAITILKEIVKVEFKSTSKSDLEYFRESFLPDTVHSIGSDIDDASEWQLKLIEGLLLQHATKAASWSGKGRQSLDSAMNRELDSPSALGALFIQCGAGILKRVGGKHFYESDHEISENLTKDDLSHITPKLWEKGGISIFTGNYIHNNNANHSDRGVLQEPVPFIDSAIRGVSNLQDWYSVIIESLQEVNLNVSSKGLESHDSIKTYIDDTLVILRDLLNQKNSATEEGKRHIFDIVINLSNTLQPELSSGLEEALNKALKNHQESAALILTEKESEPTFNGNEPFRINTELMTFIRYFAYALLKNITTDKFRLMVAPDRNSLEFLVTIQPSCIFRSK